MDIDIQSAPVSAVIFIVTIAASLYGLLYNRQFVGRFLLHPWSVVHRGRWYMPITSGFLHADFMHLIFNMMTFYFFAFPLEEIIGSTRFFIVYFGSMVLADVTCIIRNYEDPEYRSLGASGAVSGVIFSVILFAPTAQLGMLFVPVPMPAYVFALLYLAFSYFASKKNYDMTNHEAHFWGAVAGVILTVAMIPESINIFINELGF